jgi:dihydrofolate synthase/folylpolyglutamate synthase
MNDKDIRTMLKEIVSIADRVIFCRPRMERAAPTARLARILCSTKINCVEIPGVGDALLQAMADSGRRDLICVTGSLFTVGEAKEALRRLPDVAVPRVPAHKMRT